MNPFFSIIIPTYNRAHLIAETLDTISLQTFTNYEVIIVDDGSTDETSTVLQTYVDQEQVLYYLQPNTGVCAARNKGVSLASGRYLVFLDSDDLVEKKWLQDYYQLLISGNYDLVFCSMKQFSADGKFQIKSSQHPSLKGQSNGNYIPGSFCICKELFLQAGGYDPYIKYGENTELSFRLQLFKPRTGFVEAANLLYQASPDGGSKNWQNKLESTLYILNKHAVLFRKEKRVKNLYYGVAALAAYKCSNVPLARALFWKSFLSYPLNWKSLFRLLLVVHPVLAARKWNKI